MLPSSHKLAAGEARAELADIFRSHGESYCRTHFLPASQRKVMRAVSVCRTQELGGHLKQCDTCGFEHPAYNSCRNRHCPKCQSLAKAKWLEKQNSELLPVGYFHLIFTLPHVLNGLILGNRKILLALLFKAVSETLLEFGRSRLGGRIGFITVLHTWDQTLKDHFHLHCLVAGGALSLDHSRWIGARPNFLFPVTALSRVFRGKFLDLLEKNIDRGKIPAADNEIKASRQKSWVVYAKKPFGSPQTVLDYLGRYTHRVALSNDRIVKVENGEVTLSYRDRKDGDRKKTIPLVAHEFIRRFLLHVLPDGFMRVRHFGFLANRSKKQALAQCRRLLKIDPALPQSQKESAKDLLLRITGIDLNRCPSCHNGTMIVVAELPPISSSSRWDSS
ncbi:MAG: IS91 family transposase [Deltaproteobacteria bacterium]|nr:MAG: IS91 family transposase [Deltaproteobacteria bacterium]